MDTETKSWMAQLEKKLPLLGHRNWIVVTDMAYPLQSNPSIETLYSAAPFGETLKVVKQMVDKMPHVFAHIYLDSEQKKMNDRLSSGWTAYRQQVESILSPKDVKYIPHEDLIRRLDEVSRLFNVVIIKTTLTTPYSSVFFEFDCKYWDAEREKALR